MKPANTCRNFILLFCAMIGNYYFCGSCVFIERSNGQENCPAVFRSHLFYLEKANAIEVKLDFQPSGIHKMKLQSILSRKYSMMLTLLANLHYSLWSIKTTFLVSVTHMLLPGQDTCCRWFTHFCQLHWLVQCEMKCSA